VPENSAVSIASVAQLTAGKLWRAEPGAISLSSLVASPAVAVVVLAVFTVLLRLPFRITVLDHWDSVQYALGLHDFNVSAHTPQPPGSPLYILLARALLGVAGDEHLAFVLISLGASAGAVGVVYLLGRRLFSPGAGWIAALALLTQPAFWVYGAGGNSWTLLAFLAALAGLTCLDLLRGARHALVLSALTLGLASGFRLDVTVFLGPLWLWCLWRGERSPKRRLLAMTLIALCLLAWFIPVVLITPGGLERWLVRYGEMFVPAPATPTDQLRNLLGNTAVIWTYTLALFGPMLVLAVVLRARWRSVQFGLSPERRVFFALWVLPSFVFLWLVDTSEAGHALLFTVGLLPLVAGVLAQVTRPAWVRAAAAGSVAVAQAAIFLFAAPRTDRPGAFVANSALLGYTATGMRQHERSVTEMVNVIRKRFSPSDTLIVTTFTQTPFRFAMFYLPEYPVLRVYEPGAVTRVARNHQAQIVDQSACVSSNITSIVWVTEAPAGGEVSPPSATPLELDHEASTKWRLSLVDPTLGREPVPGIGRCTT
jgi:hypothetical protein